MFSVFSADEVDREMLGHRSGHQIPQTTEGASSYRESEIDVNQTICAPEKITCVGGPWMCRAFNSFVSSLQEATVHCVVIGYYSISTAHCIIIIKGQ